MTVPFIFSLGYLFSTNILVGFGELSKAGLMFDLISGAAAMGGDMLGLKNIGNFRRYSDRMANDISQLVSNVQRIRAMAKEAADAVAAAQAAGCNGVNANEPGTLRDIADGESDAILGLGQ